MKRWDKLGSRWTPGLGIPGIANRYVRHSVYLTNYLDNPTASMLINEPPDDGVHDG